MRNGTGRDWDTLLAPTVGLPAPLSQRVEISFASSQPSADEFPVTEFRRLCKEVIDGADASEILQIGSSRGYAPLRKYLLEQAATAGVARAGDDLMITNGCQQAFDLVARLFTGPGVSVVMEDPVYHGALRVFSRTGAEIVGVPVDEFGLDPYALRPILERYRPRVLIVTPSFQNPTGATLPLERRKRVIEEAERFGCVLVENDIYSELRYTGRTLPRIKQLDVSGNTILLGSYSKVSFPGLRVGWIIAPRAVIDRLAEAKEISDLHSDQLSQAVLLRFAESGELARHLTRSRQAGSARLAAVLKACERYLPPGARYTRPEGGMNLWIDLPAPLTAEGLLPKVQERGASFLSGRHFSLRLAHTRSLRISFGGLKPEQITRGIRMLGEAAAMELAANRSAGDFEAAAALV